MYLAALEFYLRVCFLYYLHPFLLDCVYTNICHVQPKNSPCTFVAHWLFVGHWLFQKKELLFIVHYVKQQLNIQM